jgi:hypothetical protein
MLTNANMQKTEVSPLYHKIANILNVDKKQVRLLVKDVGLRRINGFSNRFEHKYGTGAIRLFKTMVEDPDNSLSDVGRHFDFTREYARQAHEIIYGYSYTETLKKKKQIKKSRIKKPTKKPKVAYLREVREKMLSLGIGSHIVQEGNLYRIKSGNATFDVRISAKPLSSGNRRYFRINYLRGAIFNSDYCICLCESKDDRVYYIIPREEMPETGICLIPQAEPHESKYTKFKESWERLKRSGLVFLSEPYAQLTTPRFRTNIPYSLCNNITFCQRGPNGRGGLFFGGPHKL